MKVNVQITDMSPEEAQTIVPLLLEQMKAPKVILQQADGQQKPAEIVKVKLSEGTQAEPEKPKEEPKEEPKETPAPEPVKEPAKIGHKEAKSLAVQKIKAGKRDEVKEIIAKYADTGKVDDIPDDKLEEFAEQIKKIGEV